MKDLVPQAEFDDFTDKDAEHCFRHDRKKKATKTTPKWAFKPSWLFFDGCWSGVLFCRRLYLNYRPKSESRARSCRA